VENNICFMEEWQGGSDLDAHLRSDNFGVIAGAMDLFIAEPQVRFQTIASTAGVEPGHIAFAASGASFLSERYGWSYGVPAWLLTGYVANNRVQNGHHHWRDVIAAGAVSYGVGKLFVTPENAAHLAPVVGPQFVGMRWQRSW